MSMTLLEIVQAACGELGITQPNAVASSTDDQIKQMLALVNGLGRELYRGYEWQRLVTEYTFNTVASTESYSLPSDYGYEINQTEWDKTHHWPLQGPKSSQEWQWLKSGIISAGPRFRFRIQGGTVHINPTPSDSYQLGFEYISRYWALATDGTTYKEKFTLDDDTCVYDDQLMIDGLKMKWQLAKGFDATATLAAFGNRLDVCKAQDKSAPSLMLSRRQSPLLLSTWSIPETGYGS
jgi:hypothetical protein